MQTNNKRKPTRRDLLIVIGHLQTIIGTAKGIGQNDRNPNRAAQLTGALEAGFNLCLEALSQDKPIYKPSGPWAKAPKYGNEV